MTSRIDRDDRSETALKHLSELRPAPSVGLQDVPRESVGEHLGFSSQERKKTDDLDDRLAREPSLRMGRDLLLIDSFVLSEHMRFVYSLQEPPSSDESDEPESESDDSSSSKRVNHSSRRIRAGKQRMSIVTNRVLHSVPRPGENGSGDHDFGCGWHPSEVNGASKTSTAKRRFFQSAARWDDRMQRVLVLNEGLAMSRVSVAEMMEMGGRGGEHDVSDQEDEMEIDEEEVES